MPLGLCSTSFNMYCTTQGRTGIGQEFTFACDGLVEYCASQNATPNSYPEIDSTKQWRIQDFPEEGAPTLRGAPTYDFAKFSQKLHEIERIWTPGGGGHAPKILLCRSATERCL